MRMAKREFTAVYARSGKWITAWIEEIPGVNTQGKTMKEVKENLREALAMIFEENRKRSALKNNNLRRENLRISVPA